MSREIKFRAWDEKEKTMLAWVDYSYVIAHAIIDKRYPVMQYAGLKDKNGKEIYEGDILLCKDDDGELPMRYDEAKDEYFADSRHVVKWCDSYPAFDLDPNPNKEWNFLGYLTGGGGWVEVIGNIYENPELLEAKP